jgi:hypothetical protein
MTTPATDGNHAHDKAREDAITAAVAGISDRRAAIEQVKGVLMCVYGIDADEAFELLRRHSQDTNVKLRAFAGQLMIDLRNAILDGEPGLSREVVDRILCRVGERV